MIYIDFFIFLLQIIILIVECRVLLIISKPPLNIPFIKPSIKKTVRPTDRSRKWLDRKDSFKKEV